MHPNIKADVGIHEPTPTSRGMNENAYGTTGPAPAVSPEIQMNLSTTFFPSAILPGTSGNDPDVVLCSSDISFFYVHKASVLAKSNNFFGSRFLPLAYDIGTLCTTASVHHPGYDYCDSSVSIVPPPRLISQPPANPVFQVTAQGQKSAVGDDAYDYNPPEATSLRLPSCELRYEFNHSSYLPSESQPTFLRVEETSIVLNLMLHLIYDMSFARYHPDIETIAQALGGLRKYGIPVPTDPSAEIWSTLLSNARSNPIRVYAIAASHGASSVAKSASRYTLSTSLDTVSEGDALTMGPVYLRLLFFLHVGRQQALLRVIRAPPKEHLPTAACSISAQRRLVNAWSLAVAAVTTDTKAHGVSSAALLEAFGPFRDQNACELCRENTRSRISEMTEAWLAIKTTI